MGLLIQSYQKKFLYLVLYICGAFLLIKTLKRNNPLYTKSYISLPFISNHSFTPLGLTPNGSYHSSSSPHRNISELKSLFVNRENWNSSVHYGKNYTIKSHRKAERKTKQFVDRMDRELYLDLSGKSCVVVGSSGVLLEKELGHVIDSYDVIFRFSNAPTKGYERFVGNRTTYRITYLTSILQLLQNSNSSEILCEKFLYFLTNWKELAFLEEIANYPRVPKRTKTFLWFKVKPPEQVGIKKLLESRHFMLLSSTIRDGAKKMMGYAKRGMRSTTGFQGLVLASKLCDRPPDFAGFNLNYTENSHNGTLKYHYWPGNTKLDQRYHNTTIETEYLRKLQREGFIGKDLSQIN